jgi:ABC-2 type transport system ATP-binding protein
MRDMRALVRRLAEQGMTVLLSSHLMSEVEELCNRVGIISRGRLIREGYLTELLGLASGSYRLESTDPERARAVCLAHGVAELVVDRGVLRFRSTATAVAQLTIALGAAGVGIYALAPEAASLEELFLRLTEGPADSTEAIAAEASVA